MPQIRKCSLWMKQRTELQWETHLLFKIQFTNWKSSLIHWILIWSEADKLYYIIQINLLCIKYYRVEFRLLLAIPPGWAILGPAGPGGRSGADRSPQVRRNDWGMQVVYTHWIITSEVLQSLLTLGMGVIGGGIYQSRASCMANGILIRVKCTLQIFGSGTGGGGWFAATRSPSLGAVCHVWIWLICIVVQPIISKSKSTIKFQCSVLGLSFCVSGVVHPSLNKALNHDEMKWHTGTDVWCQYKLN